jgi:hypothetical protein
MASADPYCMKPDIVEAAYRSPIIYAPNLSLVKVQTYN